MSVGFRKSLFGFNCQDVIEYIDKTHKKFIDKERDLSDKVKELCSQLELSKAQQKTLEAEKLELDRKLGEFTEKYEEIERLSENIGKLYLVAQANARAIMENTENSAQITTEEINKNLYTIDEAHNSLKELRQSITKTSDDFVAEVDKLISSLNDTREQIAVNTESAFAAKNEFEEVYNSIVK